METSPDLSNYYAVHRQQREDLRRFAVAVATATEADRRGRLRPLAQWAKGFANELYTHHTVEDEVFFPAVLERVPSAAAVVATLDEDHQGLDPLIERFVARTADLADPRVPFAPIHAQMTELAVTLRDTVVRHLDVEDQDLLPLFYRHFSADEYDELHDRAQKTMPKTGLGFAVPFFVEALDEEGKKKALDTAPLALRLVYRATRRSHLRLVAAAFPTEDNDERKRMRTGGSVTTTIAAPPEAIYDIVADVTRTGEWSDETHRVEWTSDARGAGAPFKGWNRSGLVKWTRHCEVLIADRGRTFAFRTIPGKLPSKRDSTTWRFDLVRDGYITRVTQSYEITKLPLRVVRPIIGRTVPHHFDMRPHMAACLDRLRALVESRSTTSDGHSTKKTVGLAASAVAVLFTLAMTACGGGTEVAATPDASGQEPATSIDIKASEFAFDVSSSLVSAGNVQLKLQNDGAEPHQVLIARLHDGVSVDRYLSAASSDEGGAGSLIDYVGGINIVDPGASGTGYADFHPDAKYVLVCYIPSGDGIGHLHKGMTKELIVADTDTAEIPAPTAIADIVMQDFSFTLPQQGLAASGTYRFVNNGAQAHEFVVMRVNDDKTLNDVIPYLQAGFQGEKPLTFAGGSGGVAPGQAGFVDLALTPGQYVAMCFISDPGSHKHHVELGMLAPFTV
jgi:hemerythrin-like domain-containing protein/uncharacterized cupredoxin-like copper-binding protein